MGKIYLARERKIAGVCGGVAKTFNVNVSTVRIIWILLALLCGVGILAYFILWVISPKEEQKKDYAQRMKDKLNIRNN